METTYDSDDRDSRDVDSKSEVGTPRVKGRVTHVEKMKAQQYQVEREGIESVSKYTR